MKKKKLCCALAEYAPCCVKNCNRSADSVIIIREPLDDPRFNIVIAPVCATHFREDNSPPSDVVYS